MPCMLSAQSPALLAAAASSVTVAGCGYQQVALSLTGSFMVGGNGYYRLPENLDIFIPGNTRMKKSGNPGRPGNGSPGMNSLDFVNNLLKVAAQQRRYRGSNLRIFRLQVPASRLPRQSSFHFCILRHHHHSRRSSAFSECADWLKSNKPGHYHDNELYATLTYFCSFLYDTASVNTSSFALAERPRDALCPSIVSFNSVISS